MDLVSQIKKIALEIIQDFLFIAGFGLLIYMTIAITRLVQLTDYIQGLKGMIHQHVEFLVELEATSRDRVCRGKARKYGVLFSNFNGISVHGFFIIDRKILIQISSYVLTFVIILVEFKLNDLKGK